MKSKALYFLMAVAVVLTFTTVETVSSRLGHTLVPFKPETVNRLAKSSPLLDHGIEVAVVRGSKSGRLSATTQGPVLLPFVVASRTAMSEHLAGRKAVQFVSREGKAGRLIRSAALETRPGAERANRSAKAGRLTTAAADRLVARGLKTDSLKLIFAALSPADRRGKAAAPVMPAPMVIDSGVSAQGGPLVFVPVNVSFSRTTNVTAESLSDVARAETL